MLNECTKVQYAWGGEVYHNICTKTIEYVVPWGVDDWAVHIICLGAPAVAVVALILWIARVEL